jgi:biopolymer transport protein ExbD
MALSIQHSSRGRRGPTSTLSEINVTPFVDVLLVLLIIFMITAHVMEYGIQVDVPKTQSVKETTQQLPVITITKTGSVYLNGLKDEINVHNLAALVRGKYNIKQGVYLQADKETPFDPIAQVMSILGDEHIGVNVVTQPEDSAGRGKR